MKIDFRVPDDNKEHRICIVCKHENVDRIQQSSHIVYHCNNCNKTRTRTLYFNQHKWWIDKNKELWHESAGVFVRNGSNQYLFFERNEFPIALTIPAGHVDIGEDPLNTAKRELQEEVGIEAKALVYLGANNVSGDSCSSGADAHRLNAYFLNYDSPQTIIVKEEGDKPVWLSLEEASTTNLAPAVKKLIELHTSNLNNLASST